MTEQRQPTAPSFDPSTVEGLSAAFDERFCLVAHAVPELVLALLDETSASAVPVPRRPSRSTRQNDVAVLCGDGTADDPLRLRHAEWQTRADAQMALRMLVYQTELVREHGVSVASVVVYLVPPRGGGALHTPSFVSLYDGKPPLPVYFRSLSLPDADADAFIQSAAPSLAVLSSACRGGCEMRALRRALALLKSHFSATPHYVQLLALHFAFAELRSVGRRWKMAAESVGIEVVEEVELDGFAQMVFRRYAQGFEDGVQKGTEHGIQQERTRILNEIRRAREESQGATLEDFERTLLGKIEGGES